MPTRHNFLCKATNLSYNFCRHFAPQKLQKNRLFSVVSTFAEAMADKSRLSRAMLFCFAVSIFIVGRVGFGEILPETYQGRATQANMDETATLGAAISRGLYERCLAAQVDPLSFAVAGKMGWYLDQSTRPVIDSKIKLLVSYYVNQDTVYDGTPNMDMLTVTGVWAQLTIGDHIDQFTGTPASGTNAATYGDYPWHIYNESLQERYKVIRAQEKTASTASRPWTEVWQGEGKSTSSYSAAHAEAVGNYKFKTKGYSYPGALMQVCKATFWSNATVQGGSGLTNGTGEDGTLETNYHEGYWTNITITTNLLVTYTDIVGSNSSLEVTGELSPNIAGIYTRVANQYGYPAWSGNGWIIHNYEEDGYRIGDPESTHWTAWDPDSYLGDYEGIEESGATGTAHVAVYDPGTAVPNPSGTYGGEHPSWSQGTWYCIYIETNNKYYITQNDSPPYTPSWSHSGSSPVGTYGTINGEGLFGAPSAEYDVVTNQDWVSGHWEPSYYTPTFIGGGGGEGEGGSFTSTVFYQCWLTKIICSNDVFSSTNIEHRAGYWVKPTLPDAGTGNYWDDQGLGLSVDVWNEADISGWSSTTNNPTLFGDPVSTVPEDTVAPTAINVPNCTGFKCTEFKAVTDWDFQYCK